MATAEQHDGAVSKLRKRNQQRRKIFTGTVTDQDGLTSSNPLEMAVEEATKGAPLNDVMRKKKKRARGAG